MQMHKYMKLFRSACIYAGAYMLWSVSYKFVYIFCAFVKIYFCQIFTFSLGPEHLLCPVILTSKATRKPERTVILLVRIWCKQKLHRYTIWLVGNKVNMLVQQVGYNVSFIQWALVLSCSTRIQPLKMLGL